MIIEVRQSRWLLLSLLVTSLVVVSGGFFPQQQRRRVRNLAATDNNHILKRKLLFLQESISKGDKNNKERTGALIFRAPKLADVEPISDLLVGMYCITGGLS